MVDLAGGLVVLELVADLAAGQPAGVGLEGGVDLFGERLAGRAVERPGCGTGGVVVERERGVDVLRADLSFAVGEGVEKRGPDGMRLGAGGDLAEHAGDGAGELAVGVVPQLAGIGVQADIASGLGVFESRGEQGGEAGAGEGVVVASFR